MKQKIYAVTLVLIVILIAGSTLTSATPLGQEPGVISVYGEAEIEVTPDMARIYVGVETRNADVNTVVTENAKLIDKVLQAIDSFEGGTSVTTGSYNVHSVREQDSTYYRAVNELIVTIDDLDKLGALIDVMMAAGANQVNSIQFEAANSDAVKLLALEKAVQQGTAKAQAIANASGVQLQNIKSITEEYGSYTPYQMSAQRSMMVADIAETTIKPQNIRVHARIALEYNFIEK